MTSEAHNRQGREEIILKVKCGGRTEHCFPHVPISGCHKLLCFGAPLEGGPCPCAVLAPWLRESIVVGGAGTKQHRQGSGRELKR